MTFHRWTARAMGVSVAWLEADGARRWNALVEAYGLEMEIP
jgi:hypothetical protein